MNGPILMEDRQVTVENILAMAVLIPSTLSSEMGRSMVYSALRYMFDRGGHYLVTRRSLSTLDGFLKAINPLTEKESLLVTIKRVIVNVHFTETV